MRKIEYVQNAMGKSNVEEFIDTLDERAQKKILFVMGIVREMPVVPRQYFKKLSGTDGIWEIRVQSGNLIYRLLGFLASENTLVLTHGFQKKSQSTPPKEIELAERWKKIYHQMRKS